MDALIEYIKENNPAILEEYKRFSTPFYYETGVEYHPITNGFGCGPEGSNERFVIINGDYRSNGAVHLSMQAVKDKTRKVSVLLHEAHKKMKRVDDSVAPVGRPIPASHDTIYMTVNGVEYTIWQAYWNNGKQPMGRIIIKYGEPQYKNRNPYYEVYSYVDKGKWSIKHVTGYDSVGREHYTITHNLTLKDVKNSIFGNPEIEFKCELFGHL
jgi:hypothetical protein